MLTYYAGNPPLTNATLSKSARPGAWLIDTIITLIGKAYGTVRLRSKWMYGLNWAYARVYDLVANQLTTADLKVLAGPGETDTDVRHRILIRNSEAKGNSLECLTAYAIERGGTVQVCWFLLAWFVHLIPNKVPEAAAWTLPSAILEP